MILITSASYANAGLVSEFGKLPTCMLPVQNCRLYEHQFGLFPPGEKIVLSLPQNFRLPIYDRYKFEQNGVQTVFVPESLSLGQSVVYVLNVVVDYSEPLYLLHGDTLFRHIPFKEDCCLVASAEDNYSWWQLNSDSKKRTVYAGYFSFSSQSLLIQKITENKYDFMQGIMEYGKIIPLEAVEVKDWLDFGLVNSFYRSISKMTTQRVFNDLKVSRYSIRKISKDSNKILAEARWFELLPKKMKHYAPSLWDSGIETGKGYYEIEYYFLSSLASLFVFSRNPLFVWKEILEACVEFINDASRYQPENLGEIAERNDLLYATKTIKRIQQYCCLQGVSLENPWVINGKHVPSLKEIICETDALISKEDERFARLMHGDLCFSNILYDFKSKSIRIIDPRGIDATGEKSLYGDLRYDVAKLAHSVLGLYDFIISGRFYYSEQGDYDLLLKFEKDSVIEGVQDYFRMKTFAGYTIEELATYPIMIHLFLSMLPLHSDNDRRQKVLLANALRLYAEYKKVKS